jgi:hypothetical protein
MWAHPYAVHCRVLRDLIAYMELTLTLPASDPRGVRMYIDGALNMFRAHDRGHKLGEQSRAFGETWEIEQYSGRSVVPFILSTPERSSLASRGT